MSCCRRWPILHVVVFALAMTAWTIALLVPVPQKSAREVLGSDWGIFLFAKTIHVSIYAILTIVGGTAAYFGRKWIWVLPALVLHGALTEFFQQFTGRTARVEDVGLDTLGIAIGGFLVWWLRRISQGRSVEAASIPE
jgi:VanZ like family